MSWIDLAALALFAAFVGAGAMRGFLAGLLGVAGLVLSYAAGIGAALTLGAPVSDALELNPLLGGAIAGAAAFLLTSVVFGIVASIIKRIDRARRGESSRSAADRVGGAMIGALQGGLLVVLLYWGTAQLQAAGMLGDGGEEAEPTAMARVTQAVVRETAEAVIGDEPGAELAARAIADPSGTAREVSEIMEQPAMLQLQDDPLFWQYVWTGNVDAALNRRSFLQVAGDPRLRQQMVDMGLVSRDALTDSRVFRESTRDALNQIAPRLKGLRNDATLQRLQNDPEVAQALMAKDYFKLLSHPDVRELMNRAMAAPPAAPAE